jgi:phosphotriesterase-related protein
MGTINTVLGPIEASQLGQTLPHEHVVVTSAAIPHVFPDFGDRNGARDKAVAGLKQAFEEGVRTMLDMTPMDIGRDLDLLQDVSRSSGVNIVCSTGNWLDIPRVFWQVTPDQIATLYIREIQEGIEGTPIKAGLIKVATGPGGVTPEGETVLRAAARAQIATGVPIDTHTVAEERSGDEQVRILEDEGVAMDRVCIGHSNDSTDLGYLMGLLEKGVWLGLDRYPGGRVPGTPKWEERTEIAKKLIDDGFGHRILLSHDWGTSMATLSPELEEARIKYNPDGYSFIHRHVLPRLRELGVSDQTIDQIVIDNPRVFLEGEG